MIVDAKSAFNIVADGSDETTKINNAIASVIGQDAGETLYFGGGIYGCDGLDAIPTTLTIDGAGPDKATFKNRSASARMFELEAPVPNSGTRATAFSKFSGFGIDQNGCSAPAVESNTMYCALDWMWIRNQGGGRYGEAAVKVRKGTHFSMRDVGITNSDNCLDVEDSLYFCGDNVTLERQKGRALRVDNCAQFNAKALYVDHGNPGAAGNDVPEMAKFRGVSGLLINGLSSELAPGAGNLVNNVFMAGDDDRRAYILFDSVESGEVIGFAPSHSAGGTSAILAAVESSTIAFSGTKWTEHHKDMILFYVNKNNIAFTANNTTTRNNDQTGTVYGVAAWGGKSKRVMIKGWDNIETSIPATYRAPKIYLQAENILCEQVITPIDLFTADIGKSVLIGCPTVTGAGVAYSTII